MTNVVANPWSDAGVVGGSAVCGESQRSVDLQPGLPWMGEAGQWPCPIGRQVTSVRHRG